ncbi:group III truncated hemoglobin [Stappia sp. F7233]|uniref:Group III truncated hemoglobin n=1 Tax=Stappia albiluteola TaxID=2758565 RepID=A0A839AJA3_9HYPH|nr:group III truncated hemoglobin [Stappia albiluteola]MBA5779024.1 group III truncated hemoglobin [Stappia albiluteola]
MTEIDIRPAGARNAVHPSIDADGISRLVDTFYGRIREHPRLGPIFEAKLEGNWTPHLQKMKLFWHSVLLKSGAYKGRPVPTHLALKSIVSSDYGEWLAVFRPVAHEVFEAEAAEAVIEVAERIAQSLWLATFGFAGSDVPGALKSSGG